MNLLRPTAAFLFFLTSYLQAGVVNDTNINDVFNRGANELVGSITWRLEDDAFRLASPATPIFMRVTPASGAHLAETLVDMGSKDPVISQSIWLALRLDGESNTSMEAHPETASIVRWVAGESAFWVRIQESSENWLMQSGNTAPNIANRVSITVGISARISDTSNDADAMVNASNLPFNTRDANAEEGQTHLATSTLFCLDLTQSTLQADGTLDGRQDFDIIAFDHGADLGNGIYSAQTANNIGITFTNDFTVASGKTLQCGFPTVTTGQGMNLHGQLNTHIRTLQPEVVCHSTGFFLGLDMTAGSSIRIRANRTGFGFEESGTRFIVTGEPEGVVTGNPNTMININGVDLFTEIDLTWTGTDLDFREGFSMELALRYDPANPPLAEVDMDLNLATNAGAADAAPYDGVDQNARCQPSHFFVDGPLVTIETNTLSANLPLWPSPVTILDLIPLVEGTL